MNLLSFLFENTFYYFFQELDVYKRQDNNTSTKYWRIRHGAIDKDTSLAIPAILALKLKNSGKIVNFAVPWGQGHGGDYDLEALFNWIDSVVKNNF